MVKDCAITVMTSRTEPMTMTPSKAEGGAEVECVKCECCKLTEECTPSYIRAVKETNHGKWICGLCTEAVKDEMERSCSDSEEEALDRHMRFCMKFRSSVSSPPVNTTEDLICAVKMLMIKSLESPGSSGCVEPDGAGCRESSGTVASDECCFRLDD